VRTNVWSLSLVSLVLAIAFVYDGSASATDGKYYSEAECEDVQSTGHRCPVIRDNTIDNPGLSDVKVWITNASGTTSCGVNAVNRDLTVQNTTLDSSSASGFQVLHPGAPATTGAGSVTVDCLQGSSSSTVNGYWVAEF